MERALEDRALLEHAGIGIGYWSPEGRLLLLNDVAAAHLNATPRDFIGKSASKIVERIARAALSDESLEYEDSVPLPTGTKWFLSTFRRILDSRGRVSGVQILSHDISARKRAEEALEAERNLLRTLTRNVPDLMYLKNTESRYLFANRPSPRAGRSSEDAAGRDAVVPVDKGPPARLRGTHYGPGGREQGHHRAQGARAE